MQDKPHSPSHGLPVSRAKTGYFSVMPEILSGDITRPGRDAAPTSPCQMRDTTNRPAGETHDRGLLRSRAGEKPAGGRLATDKRHRADTERLLTGLPDYHKALPRRHRLVGAGAGGGIASKILRMVPMPRFLSAVGGRGLHSSFALCLLVAS